MLKRKFGNRSDWKRIVEKEYIHTSIHTKQFKGIVSLLHVQKVNTPLFVQYGNKDICIVADGYIWLQHFPENEHYSLTTMFNAEGEIVQWYIDICLKNGFDNDGPWMDDLFLDIIVLPTEEVFLKDEDEIEEALSKGIIDEFLYQLAWTETNKIQEMLKQDKFLLLNLAKTHKEYLLRLISS